jgi:hypothetical protein
MTVNLTSAKLHGKIEKPVDETEKLKIQQIPGNQTGAGILVTFPLQFGYRSTDANAL